MLKMYFLVLHSLSPIQQWIQAWHAAVEYMHHCYRPRNDPLSECVKRAVEDKTFIILNGWTTETMANHAKYLDNIWHSYATFQEPDLNNITTAIAFIAKDGDPITEYFTKCFKLA